MLKRVAVGGMAELYLARDTEADRLVVIKRILPYLAQELDFVRMFLDEARIAAQLHHPTIITMYELGSLEGSIFIAMEFVEGVDLRKILQQEQKRGGVVPPHIAAWLTARLCEGLHYAHNRSGPDGKPMGIIHRDVSPQNLMVGYRGEVKLVDFGIAKASALMERSKPGVIKGKFLYLSPEQLSQERIDHRSDLFALGTMLYEVCVGKSPFFKPTTEAVIYAIRAEDPPPPALARPGFPQALSKVIMKCLTKERTRRYQQADEVRKDLEAYLTKEAPTTRADVVSYVSRLFGAEEERTVMFLPGEQSESGEQAEQPKEDEKPVPKSQARTARARSIRLPIPPVASYDTEGEESSVTAPEGRRPTPAPMKNPFEEEARTVMGPPEETRPLPQKRERERERTEATAQIARPPPPVGSEEFLEPTAISQSGKRPTGESLPQLTPPLGSTLGDPEPTHELPPTNNRSSKVFDVPFEFARDEVPSAPLPRSTRGAPAPREEPEREPEPEPSSSHGEDSIGNLIEAAHPSPRRSGVKKVRRLGGGSDEDDNRSTGGYRRSEDDDIPSMVTSPSMLNEAGDPRFKRLVIGGTAAIFVIVAVLAVLVVRSQSGGKPDKPDKQVAVKPVPKPTGPEPAKDPKPSRDAGAAAAGGGAGTAVATGPGGAGGAGGAGVEPVPDRPVEPVVPPVDPPQPPKPVPPVVATTRVYFDAPKGSRVTVKGKGYKVLTDTYFNPGPYSLTYQCFNKRRRTFGQVLNTKMMVPRQPTRFKVKLVCR